MAAATLGTMLNTFAVVLNNHTVAAVSAAVALYATVRIVGDGERRLRYFALAGFAAAFTAADELPALTLAGLRRPVIAVACAAADVDCVCARGRGGRGSVLRHELDRPRKSAAAVHAPQRDRSERQLVQLHVHRQRSRDKELLARPAGDRQRRAKPS